MNKFLYFAISAGIGAGLAWYVCRSHYRKMTEDEIASVVDAFKQERQKQLEAEKATNEGGYVYAEPGEHADIRDHISMSPDVIHTEQIFEPKYAKRYQELLRKEHYSPREGDISKEGDPLITKPYIISPGDFDSLDDYESICYTYYADGILVDEDEEPLSVDEIARSVGLDYAAHFGDYEDDAVHIRNDNLRVDYEIVRDLREYGELHERE